MLIIISLLVICKPTSYFYQRQLDRMWINWNKIKNDIKRQRGTNVSFSRRTHNSIIASWLKSLGRWCWFKFTALTPLVAPERRTRACPINHSDNHHQEHRRTRRSRWIAGIQVQVQWRQEEIHKFALRRWCLFDSRDVKLNGRMLPMVGWDEEGPFCNTTRSIEWRNFIIIILEWTTRGTLL